MTIGIVSALLMQGAYCRCGETGRGQLWLLENLVGTVGPRILRLMRNDPLIEERVVYRWGVPRRAYCALGVEVR